MKIFFLLAALLLAVLTTACASRSPGVLPGSDRDAHGCIPSAGYEWDQVQQECIRPWEKK